jgi:succinate dehydrogenase / fumarate reductase flavoprotein subunit
VNKTGQAVYLDFSSAFFRYGKTEALTRGIKDASQAEILEMGRGVVKSKYGNLFDMYKQITAENPYETPMMIYPAVHYTMGGLWVDYNLMTTVPGLFAAGEANFSDHGANRLGASALMQGLADGYFVLPYTIGDYLSDDIRTGEISTDRPEFVEAEKNVKSQIAALINNKGDVPVDDFHRRLGLIMWNKCGMSRNEKALKEAIKEIQELRHEFYARVSIPGSSNDFNPELDKAMRVADFLELGESMCLDALARDESCGGHFREEFQTEDGEALRDDLNYKFVSAWECKGAPSDAKLHKEDLVYENIELKQRSYK